MRDLFRIKEGGDETTKGRFSDGGASEVVVNHVMFGGNLSGYNRDTGEKKTMRVLSIGFETRDGKRHAFSLFDVKVLDLTIELLDYITNEMSIDELLENHDG